jgi:hypothetical protein
MPSQIQAMPKMSRPLFLFRLVCAVAATGWLWAFLALKWTVDEITNATDHTQRIPSYPFGGYLGGNPSEVLSHLCGFLCCSAVFAVIMAVGLAERRILHPTEGAPARRTVMFALGFVPAAWAISVWHLDGEGTLIAGGLLLYLPLLVAAFGSSYLVLSKLNSWRWDTLLTLLCIAAIFTSQCIFQPSDTGAPNATVLIFVGIAVGLFAWTVPCSTARHLPENNQSRIS